MSKPIPIPRPDSGECVYQQPGYGGANPHTSSYNSGPRRLVNMLSTTPNSAGSLTPAVSTEDLSLAGDRLKPMGTPKYLRGEIDPIKFKTSMCQYFVRHEACPYDPNCAFAHGPEELRTAEENYVTGTGTLYSVNSLPREILERQTSSRSDVPINSGPDQRYHTGINPQRLTKASPPKPSYLSPNAAPSISPKPASFSHNPYNVRVTLASPENR